MPDHAEQVEHFEADLERLIERYRKEYDMMYASMIGLLQMKVIQLTNEMEEDD